MTPCYLPCYNELEVAGSALLDRLISIPEEILLTRDSDLRVLEGQVITLLSYAMSGRFSGKLSIQAVLICDA